MARGWTNWGLAAAAALALAPAARADDRSKAEQKADQAAEEAREAGQEAKEAGHEAKAASKEAAREAKQEGSEVRASAEAGAKQASRHDNSDIITKLHAENAMEVEAAKVAEDNAEREDVKQFAAQMVKDHGDLKKALEKLADDRKVKLDEDAQMKRHEAHLAQMKDMKGARFDQHFTSMMVQHHEKDLKEVKAGLKRANETGDHELAQVLESAKTTIEAHHRTAKELDQGKGQRMGRRGADRGATQPSSDPAAPGAPGGATDQQQTR